jgi:hypothetical protein
MDSAPWSLLQNHTHISMEIKPIILRLYIYWDNLNNIIILDRQNPYVKCESLEANIVINMQVS